MPSNESNRNPSWETLAPRVEEAKPPRLTKRQAYYAKLLKERYPYDESHYAHYIRQCTSKDRTKMPKSWGFGRHAAVNYAIRHIRNEERDFYVKPDLLKQKQAGHYAHLNETLKDPSKEKSPLELKAGSWIGVEIECVIPLESLGVYREDHCYEDSDEVDSDALYNAAKKAFRRHLRGHDTRNVYVKHDGSIDFDSWTEIGFEVTCFFRVTNKKPLESLCKALRAVDAKVNKSCGLHVHLDCRDIANKYQHDSDGMYKAVDKRANRLGNALPVLLSMVPETRRDNSYCRPYVSDYGDRYFAINKSAFGRFRTIEVRLHSATTNYTKIANWVDILYRISRSKYLTRTEAYSADHLADLARLTPRLREYMMKRIAIFTDRSMLPDAEDQDTQDAA